MDAQVDHARIARHVAALLPRPEGRPLQVLIHGDPGALTVGPGGHRHQRPDAARRRGRRGACLGDRDPAVSRGRPAGDVGADATRASSTRCCPTARSRRSWTRSRSTPCCWGPSGSPRTATPPTSSAAARWPSWPPLRRGPGAGVRLHPHHHLRPGDCPTAPPSRATCVRRATWARTSRASARSGCGRTTRARTSSPRAASPRS